ncbi:peptidase C14, caspase domain-containing protein, partial [Desarmillaria tabescens]
LNGCISDALLMEKYLTKDLGVPKEHIEVLIGPKEHASTRDQKYPTYANIISALLGLINDSEIAYGDNIVIYFAGHGSYYPPEEDGDEYIEALCPIDRDILDANGANPVPDISDREFNTILRLISQAKGPHITVILDCCHSGGASR